MTGIQKEQFMTHQSAWGTGFEALSDPSDEAGRLL